MTVATATPTNIALEERFAHVALDLIDPSKVQPRTIFPADYLEQLKDSIAEKGILEPVLLRPRRRQVQHGPIERFEIVAGECRCRAARLAGLIEVPAVSRSYTDEQVLEIQLEENIHRKNLTPLEEAVAYRRLINTNPDKHSAASIATRIGMSVTYVWDYLKLNDLIPEAKTILAAERMTVGHAILIARLKPEDQARVLDPGQGRNGYVSQQAGGLWQYEAGRLFDDELVADAAAKKDEYRGLKTVSVRELDVWIKTHVRFDVAHMAKAQPLVFEQTAAVVDEAAAKPGRGKKVVPITFSHYCPDGATDPSERTYGATSWKKAVGKDGQPTCEYAVLGLVVVGEHYGASFHVCLARDRCTTHWKQEVAQREKNQTLREAGKGKQAAARENKQKEAWEARRNREQAEAKAETEHWHVLRPHVHAALVAAIKPSKLTNAVMSEIVRARMDNANGRTLAAVEKLLGGRVTIRNFTRAIVLSDVIKAQWSRYHTAVIAKRYKVDLVKIAKAHAPTPAAAAPAKKA